MSAKKQGAVRCCAIVLPEGGKGCICDKPATQICAGYLPYCEGHYLVRKQQGCGPWKRIATGKAART